ncbi:MAG: S8 family serine peptidase [Pirellulales bacterium]
MSVLSWKRRVGSSLAARRGRTLIELLVAVAIVGTVMSLVFVAVSHVYHAVRQDLDVVDPLDLEMAAIQGTPIVVESPPPEITPGPSEIPDQFLVIFQDWVADPASAAGKLVAGTPGGKVLEVYDTEGFKGCNVLVPGGDPTQLQNGGGVAYVENDAHCFPCGDYVPTGVSRMRTANNARNLPRYSPTQFALPNVSGTLVVPGMKDKIVVAVIDTGVDPTHRDLNVNRAMSRGFGSIAPNFTDQHGHGTHVAGIIGARADNQGIVGVYPGVEIWSLRVFDARGAGNWGSVAQALAYVWQHRDKISSVNMSLSGGRSRTINDLVDRCSDAGVAVVVAAGNSATDAAPTSPASAAKAICVAALADSDGRYGGVGRSTSAGPDDTFATFSSFGSVVDVIAPGVNIVSTYPGNRYASMSGTSMAAPHVAGLLGLYHNSVVTAQVGGRQYQRRATGLEIVSILVSTRGVEAIRGRYDNREYPLLLGPQ